MPQSLACSQVLRWDTPCLEKCMTALICIQVRVGSLSDPLDTPGLAHFCEHMLFYASAKYPEEDAYSKFVVSSRFSWYPSIPAC